MKKNRGHTLIEVIVTMAIFSIVTLAVFGVYDKGMRYYRKLSGTQASFRDCEMTFGRISREITCDAEAILYPTGYEGDSVVFNTFATSEKPSETVGYIYDSGQLCIKRVRYAEFDPYNPSLSRVLSAAGNPQTLVTGVKSVKYTLMGNGLMQITMDCAGAEKEYSFSTKIPVR